MTGKFEVLIPAVKLLGLTGVEISAPDDGVTYVHILFERHEVILAEGALVESLMHTDYVNSVTTGLEQSDRDHVGPARLIVDGKKAKQLVARIIKNQRSAYDPKTKSDLEAVAA